MVELVLLIFWFLFVFLFYKILIQILFGKSLATQQVDDCFKSLTNGGEDRQ